MKPIATDIYSFEKLIVQNKTYVDKTALLYRLINGEQGELFFLSRPRRFGKSLMISTLKAIFEGKKELFNGLAISHTEYDWKPYPVIHLDLSGVRDSSIERMERLLIEQVKEVANRFEITLQNRDSPAAAFSGLWRGIREKNLQVVVLIDEYDVPMQGFLDDPESLAKVQGMLHDFYLRLKENSESIRFLMMTGVSRFAKLSIFSGLNNLVDISMRAEFATLLGYTESELDSYFREYIQAFAESRNGSYDEIRMQLRQWYNGYHFSKDMTAGVYNPVSIGLALTTKELEDYWIQTGGASLILERLRQEKKIPSDLEDIPYTTAELNECDAVTMSFESLLYQAGYLTIKKASSSRITLGIPNREVRSSLSFQFLRGVIDRGTEGFRANHEDACEALSQGKLEQAIQLFRSSISGLPFSWLIHDEGASKIAFLSFFYPMPDARISTEKEISSGRIDAIIETQAGVYIFEFKYGKTAQIAHAQILDKGYAEPYRGRGKPVFAIGLNFSPEGEMRGIDEAVVSQIV